MPHPKGGYRINGKRVPGVTTIIGRFDDKENLMEWAFRCGVKGVNYKMEGRRAADAGSAAHDAVEAYIDGGKPDWDAIAKDRKIDKEQVEMAKLAAGAFYAWRAKYKPQFVETETEYISTEHRFGGCLDAIAIVGGKKYLTDWKTSKSIHKGYFVQAAAYTHMWEDEHGETLDGAIIVRLCKKTGLYEVYTLPREELTPLFEEFVHMRELYDMKVKNGTIRYAKLQPEA